MSDARSVGDVDRMPDASIVTLSRRNATIGPMNSVAVLLAAGAGSRFSDVGHKLLAWLPQTAERPPETVIARSLDAVSRAGFDLVVVVTGRLDAGEMGLDQWDGPAGTDLVVVDNPTWADGQASSVRAGLTVARASGAEVAVVGLADQPGVAAESWAAVAAAASTATPFAVATYRGRRANPSHCTTPFGTSSRPLATKVRVA